ncbi:CDP-glycerol glycerophosphotransferase family protein, partial [[Clostridium] innocuum]|nr:CDP-glycerol glycerophosphotransferase family protein [[Clostridium] innocuum]
KQRMQLPLDKNIVLYAPTWRDNSFVTSGYTFDLQADFRKWKEILGDDSILLFKPHYLIINKFENDPMLEGFLYSIDAKEDINDLYVIADQLITDYSSVFFDYAILNRPIYFYMYDLDEYKEELRGFYLDIYKDLPGDIFETEEDLLQAVQTHCYDFERLNEFNRRFNHAQSGNCSEKVCDIVFAENSHGN